MRLIIALFTAVLFLGCPADPVTPKDLATVDIAQKQDSGEFPADFGAKKDSSGDSEVKPKNGG